jgi:Fur family ferric uptake transcriptional regulator
MIAATQSNHPLGPVATPEPVEQAVSLIRQSRLRLTKPRLAIIKSMQQLEAPVSIEHLREQIGADVCDLVTIYRCMSTFEDLGIVRRSYRRNGTCLFELNLQRANHAYVVCQSCNRTERIDSPHFESIDQMLSERGYSRISSMIQFSGICPDCQQAAADRPGSRWDANPQPAVQESPNSMDSAGL